jgi:hypothetical protein
MSHLVPGTANEVLLLESRLQQQRNETHPAASEDEYFLISSIDTVLRVRGLSYQEIEDGIVEGGNDGGIDAVYTFYNGVLIEDESEATATDKPQIDLEIIQAKNERGFKEVALQRLLDHLPLLLQLDDNSALRKEFNEQVLERFGIFRALILRVWSRFPELSIRVRYVTKSIDVPNQKVLLKAERLGPATPEQDLALAAFSWVPLHVRYVVAAEGFTDFAARPRRLGRFLGTYGWSRTTGEFLDVVEARMRAHAAGIRGKAAAGDEPSGRLLRQGVPEAIDQALADLASFPR